MGGFKLDRRKELLVLGVVLAAVVAGVLLLYAPDSAEQELPADNGQMTQAQQAPAELGQQVASPVVGAATSAAQDEASSEGDEDLEGSAEEESEDPAQAAASLAQAIDASGSLIEASPALVAEPTWRVLDRIATWYSQPSAVSGEMILSYLSHGKLWARLATLQFMLANPEVLTTHGGLLDIAREGLVRGEHPSQVRRFLERARAVDLVLYQKMKEFLGV